MKSVVFTGLLLGLALVPSAYLAWQARDVPHLGSFHDDAIYLESARGLARGEGYRLGTLPGQPAQTKYPPLYPAWLSLAWAGDAPVPVAAGRALWLTWIWLPVLVTGSYQLAHRLGWPRHWALAMAMIVAIHPDAQLAATRIMSDLPFAALAVWALVLAPGAGSWICAGLGFWLRTAALPLFAGLCAGAVWARRWRSAAWQAGAMLLAVGSWMTWSQLARIPATTLVEQYYTDYFAYQLAIVPLDQLPAHAYSQLDALLRALARLALLDAGDGLLGAGTRLLVGAAMAAGLVRLLRRKELVAGGVYAILSLVMSLCWYFPPDSRTLLPLLPILVLAWGEELANLRRMLGLAWQKGGADRGVAVVLGLGLALLPVSMLRQGAQRWHYEGVAVFALERGFLPGKLAAYEWIRQNLPPEKTFFAVDDPVLSLYTGRKAMRFPLLDQIYRGDAVAGYSLNPQALQVMHQQGLDCLFVSRQHFDPNPGNPYVTLRFQLDGTPLKEHYRSRLELVACPD
jgi:hypothetical protein